MKTSKLIPIATLSLLLAGSALAQERGVPSQEKAGPIPASAKIVKSAERCEVTLPVTGLTAEKEAKVKVALEGLKAEVYRCAGCQGEFRKAGKCPKCDEQLVVSNEVVLDEVSLDVAKSRVSMRTKRGMELRLSALERALRAESVSVDEPKLVVAGEATLVMGGAKTAAQAASIQKAFVDAELFETAHAAVTNGEVRVRVAANETPWSLERIRDVIGRSETAFKVVDVIWNDWTPEV